MSDEKRYSFNVVEQMVLNPDYRGYRSARIEVTDNQADSPYPIYEASVLLPEEFFDDFVELFDFKDADLMPYIRWDNT
jgi:hypothetical protein